SRDAGQLVLASQDEAAAHEEIARQVAHERQFRCDDEIGALGLRPPGPTDDQRGVARNVAGGGIDLKKRNSQTCKRLHNSVYSGGVQGWSASLFHRSVGAGDSVPQVLRLTSVTTTSRKSTGAEAQSLGRVRPPNAGATCRLPGSLILPQSPLDARVGDAESLPFGVALGSAAGLGSNHRQVAAGLRGIIQAALKQCSLGAAMPPFGDGAGAREQRYAVMNRHAAGCHRTPVQFAQKRKEALARSTGPHEVRQPGHINDILPARGQSPCPEILLFLAREAHLHLSLVDGTVLSLEGQKQNAGQFDGPVAAIA